MNEEDLLRLYQRGTEARRSAGRVDCPPPESLLAAVEHRAPEDERLRTINHAMTCPECGEELELLRSTRIVRERIRLPRFGFAIAASAVLAVGLGYYTLARSRSTPPDDVVRDAPGDMQLVAPATPTVGRLDSLVWRSAPGATGYVVEVRRADGSLIGRASTIDTVLVAPAIPPVTPGSDVYWSVTARLADGTELRSVMRRIRITP